MLFFSGKLLKTSVFRSSLKEKSMEIEKEFIDETKKLLPQAYADIAQPTVKEVGTTLGRSVKVLLAPIRGFCWCWEKIEQMITEGVEKRLASRPQENIKTPEPEIAVPLIQTLFYTAQKETLREMYLNLLANSMDKSQDKIVHPSFVDIIRQMDYLDATLFKILSPVCGYMQVINPKIRILGQEKIILDKTPEWYLLYIHYISLLLTNSISNGLFPVCDTIECNKMNE
jgi:hypothetical protein